MQHPQLIRIPLLAVSFACSLALVHCDDEPSSSVPETTLDAAMPADASSSDAADAAAPVPAMPPSSCGGLIGDNLCDPVTGWPCDVAAGAYCDYSGTSGFFQCFPALPGPTAGFCETCGDYGPSCAAGLTCNYLDWCERFCCADSDCGLGTCLFDVFGDPKVAAIGYCYQESAVTCLGFDPGDLGITGPVEDAGARSALDGGSPTDGGATRDGGSSSDGGAVP